MTEEKTEKKMSKSDWVWIGLFVLTFIIGYFLG